MGGCRIKVFGKRFVKSCLQVPKLAQAVGRDDFRTAASPLVYLFISMGRPVVLPLSWCILARLTRRLARSSEHSFWIASTKTGQAVGMVDYNTTTNAASILCLCRSLHSEVVVGERPANSRRKDASFPW